MLNVRLPALAVLFGLSILSVSSSSAVTLQEDFSANPAAHGWRSFGDPELFSWDSTRQNLRVTWDSSRTNSYFCHPLGTTLGKDDDFSLALDLRLSDIATNIKSGPFEIAVGFLNFAAATNTTFERGSGVDPVHGPRNIVELDYFPAGYYAGFGDVAPSLSPTIVSADNTFASGFDLLELTTNDLFHISLAYSASDQTLRTVISRNGSPFGPIAEVTLATNFTDFRVDTVAISSYSDFGDDYDSVLGHGWIDNLVITTPTPPVAQVVGSWNSGQWQVQVTTHTNWLYSLERTTDFVAWQAVSPRAAGSGTTLLLQDTSPPPVAAFYRVSATRP